MTRPQTAINRLSTIEPADIGFRWWKVSAWLGLTLGNLLLFGQLFGQLHGVLGPLPLILIIVNSGLMIMILQFNKYAFLLATILSLNPLLWIINGIYLTRRWHHPRVNGAPTESISSVARTTPSEPQDRRATHLPTSSRPHCTEPVTISQSDEEALYEQAANEIGSDSLKRGLWAKSLADADGNDTVAKARYIKARTHQLIDEFQRQLDRQEEERRHIVETARQTQLAEQQRAYLALPKGKCPNCAEIISLTATECQACQAVFTGPGSWKPTPL